MERKRDDEIGTGITFVVVVAMFLGMAIFMSMPGSVKTSVSGASNEHYLGEPR
jgi:hypothetical protein